MRVAIYGDSFAASVEDRIETGWAYLLGKKFGEPSVNFAKIASNTYYSYKLFIQNYKNFDYNIFLFTVPYRYTKILHLDSLKKYEYFSHLSMVEWYLKHYEQKLSSEDKNLLENLRGWFIVSDDEFMEEAQLLMLKEIINKDKNVLLYPSFPHSVTTRINMEIERDFSASVMHWANKVEEWFNIALRDYNENHEIITCHMTPEINSAFADAIYNYITTGKKIEIPKVIEHKHKLEHYYTKGNFKYWTERRII